LAHRQAGRGAHARHAAARAKHINPVGKHLPAILESLSAADGMVIPAFCSKPHAEVIELHDEPANFAFMLRCTCLIYLEKTAPQAIAADWPQAGSEAVLTSDKGRSGGTALCSW
jgi:hypothetical protein